MLTLMLQNILIALYMIFATELIITKQFPYSGSFVSDMNRTIPIKEVIQSLLSSSLFIKYINWCMCFFGGYISSFQPCYHLNPYPVVQKGGLSNMVQGLFLIFTDDRGRGRSLTYIDPGCLLLRCLVFVLKPDMLAVVHGFPVLQAVLVEVQQECGEWENGEWIRQGEERYGEEEDEGGGHAGV